MRVKKEALWSKNIPDYGPAHVAQHTIALMLAGARNIVRANKDVQRGNFKYQSFLGISLAGKTLGVIGAGRIGCEVIKIANVLGMNTIAYDIYKNETAASELGFSYAALDEVLKTSDVVTLHIPSTPETKHILNRKTLMLLNDRTILVNTARGDLIDETALVDTIEKFHAVCLDVLEDERLFSNQHPLLDYENVIITPHCAFYSDEAIRAIAEETLRIIRK